MDFYVEYGGRSFNFNAENVDTVITKHRDALISDYELEKTDLVIFNEDYERIAVSEFVTSDVAEKNESLIIRRYQDGAFLEFYLVDVEEYYNDYNVQSCSKITVNQVIDVEKIVNDFIGDDTITVVLRYEKTKDSDIIDFSTVISKHDTCVCTVLLPLYSGILDRTDILLLLARIKEKLKLY